MNKYGVPNTSQLITAKADAVLETVNRRLAENGRSDVADVWNEVTRAVYTFFDGLRNPITKPYKIEPGQSRDLDAYNEFLRSVQQDTSILRNETELATSASVQTFNYNTTVNERLRTKAQRIASKAEDLAIISNLVGNDLFVAGDRFADSGLIDRTSNNGQSLEVAVGGGGVTLPRTGAATLVNTNTPINITPKILSGGVDVTAELSERLYEGKYYARIGEVEPEGDTFRWTQEVRRRIQTPDGNTELSDPVSPGEYEGTPRDFEVLIKPTKALDEDLARVRGNLFDADPSTYWQIELSIPVEDRFLPELEKDLTVSELDRAVRTMDVENDIDLQVQLEIDLQEIFTINWINLSPNNFGAEAWVDILELSTSTDNITYEPVDGFLSNKYENVLTPEANEELTDNEVLGTLAASRYQYAGQGIWQFAPREARFVRATLQQKVPVTSPYQVYHLMLSKHVTTTKTTSEERGLFG